MTSNKPDLKIQWLNTSVPNSTTLKLLTLKNIKLERKYFPTLGCQRTGFTLSPHTLTMVVLQSFLLAMNAIQEK